MIDLNFIIPEELVEIRHERILRLARDTGALLVFVTALSAIVMLWGRNEMQRSIADITDVSAALPIQQAELESKVQSINQQIVALQNVQKGYHPWARNLAELARLVPTGNKLTYFELMSETNTLTLRGISTTRENLLAMKDAFEKAAPWVTQVTMPISNLLSRENIVFEMKIELTPSVYEDH